MSQVHLFTAEVIPFWVLRPPHFASLSSVYVLICAMQKNERLAMVSAGACECRFPLGSALPHLPSTPFAVELWHENITTDKISKAVI